MDTTSDSFSPKRVLEPAERIFEVLFGLIMVLTFTGSLSALEAGRSDVRTMLIGAIGCNLAWGLIDAIMYLMGCLFERAANWRIVAAARLATTEQKFLEVIRPALPSMVASALTTADLRRLQGHLANLPDPVERATLTKRDLVGAFAVFLLVVASTAPVSLPFVLFDNASVALRISNAIAVTMMLIAGYTFGKLTGYRPWVTAGSMVLVGSFLVTVTIALGG